MTQPAGNDPSQPATVPASAPAAQSAPAQLAVATAAPVPAPAQAAQQSAATNPPVQAAQAAALSQAAGAAPAGSVKVTATPGKTPAAPSPASTAGSAVAAQSAASDSVTGPQTVPSASGGATPQNDPGAGSNSGPAGTPGGAVPPAPPVSAAPAGGQTADANSAPASTQTDQASAPSGTPTPVALGLLGDPSLIQQVPITAQGVGSASTGAVVPPGMDNRTLALDPVNGGSPALTGDVALAATAAATQGIVQAEEPSAASSSTAATFTLPQAAEANPSEQVKIQVSKGLKDGSDTINVLLHPEDLGTVEVKLQMQDGQVKATITADNPDTLSLLKGDAHQLVQSLQDAGFNTDSNSLNFEMRGEQQQNGALAQQQQGQGSGQSSNSGSNSGHYTSDSVEDEQPTTAPLSDGSSASGLDISV